MAEKKKSVAAKPKAEGFVTKSELNEFADGILSAIDKRLASLGGGVAPAASVAAVSEKEAVAKAGPNKFSVNEEWEEDAQKVLGEKLDHTEVVHERNGGIKYTVVIKKKFSNAPQQYLDLVGTDRRTKEVGSGGFSAVQEWNKLIAQNLSHPNREMRS